jgi:hypothetical protein
MTNPVIHAIVFGAAVLIPGGLLIYFAWKAYKCHARKIKHDSVKLPTPDEARSAFFRKYPKKSLRALSRKNQLDRVKALRHRNSQK